MQKDNMKNLDIVRKNFKDKLKKRKKLFGGWVSFGHASITETFSYAGFDFLAIDMEHSTISLDEAQRIIASSQSENIPCFPRPVSHSNDWFKPLLDSGADGVIVSTVETVEEVENIINCIKYPPVGKRTYGVNRAQKYGFDTKEYFSKWNESSVIIIQIESIKAVNNIEKLIEFKDVDGVMIGPYDLSGSLGIPGETTHPLVIEASKKVIKVCNDSGKSCGTQIADPNDKNLKELFDLGYTFAILGSDLFALWKWSQKMSELIKNYKP